MKAAKAFIELRDSRKQIVCLVQTPAALAPTHASGLQFSCTHRSVFLTDHKTPPPPTLARARTREVCISSRLRAWGGIRSFRIPANSVTIPIGAHCTWPMQIFSVPRNPSLNASADNASPSTFADLYAPSARVSLNLRFVLVASAISLRIQRAIKSALSKLSAPFVSFSPKHCPSPWFLPLFPPRIRHTSQSPRVMYFSFPISCCKFNLPSAALLSSCRTPLRDRQLSLFRAELHALCLRSFRAALHSRRNLLSPSISHHYFALPTSSLR